MSAEFQETCFFSPFFFLLILPIVHSTHTHTHFQTHANTTVQLLITYFTLGLCVCVKKKKWKMAFEPQLMDYLCYTLSSMDLHAVLLKKKKAI